MVVLMDVMMEALILSISLLMAYCLRTILENPEIQERLVVICSVDESKLRMADSWDEFKSELAKRGVHLEFVYKDKERTKEDADYAIDALKAAVARLRG